MTNLDKFMEEYAKQLPLMLTKYPERYAYGIELCPTVVERMHLAIQRGSFSHHGEALRATCKALGIKHTRTAIATYCEERESL